MNNPIRVLYVEDNPHDRELVLHRLEKTSEGFELALSTDRKDFESRLTQGNWDVVLSDLNILGFDGLEVIQAVKQVSPETPIIILTGTGSEEMAAQAIKTGAIDYVIKSGSHIQRLPETIHRAIRSKELENERRGIEEALRRSEARLTSLVENLFDAIVVTDRKGKIQFVNAAACELFGREKSRFIGTEFGFSIELNQTFEIQVNSSNGDSRYAEVRATMTEWNAEPAYLISLRDVTERRQAQEEREQMNTHLQQLQKMETIGTLAGGIAHDFNNILSPILGFTQLAMDQARKNPMLQDCLEQVFQAGNRAKELVKQILAFSRQTERESKPLLLSPIVKEVLKMLRSTIPTTIEIQQHIHSDHIVMGDATGIHQILMNLCTNAKHAMEDAGGTLSVSLEDVPLPTEVAQKHPDLEPGTYVRLRVEDTGCGMDPFLLEKIFEPYFTTKEKEKGTGLGLSVTHGIVKDFKGEIVVSSRPGKGTVFDVYFPGSRRPKEAKQMAPAAALKRGSEHILLVDDEPAMVKLNQQVMERLGYRVTARTSSVEALELFKAKPAAFDLLLTDMTMPNLTGDKLAEACTRIRPDFPVVLTTGFSEKVDEQKVKEKGIQALLYKPVSHGDLAETLRAVLDDKPGKPAEKIPE